MRRYLPIFPLLLLLAAFTIVIILAAGQQRAVTMVDYWYHMQWARALSIANVETWVHPFYAVGYFALLRLGLALGIDMVAYGQAVSWVGAVLSLSAVYAIVYAATRKTAYALAAAALLAIHPFFRFQTLQEGTDMLAAGLQLAALAILFIAPTDDRRASRIAALAAGAVLGGAYLIRYTTLALLPVAAVYLLLRDWRSWRRLALSGGLLLGAFVLVALPQLAASTVVRGTPIYNEQARNVWFGIHGDFNWTDNWSQIPPGVTLGQVIRDDPAAFGGHWANEAGRFFTYDAEAYADDPLGLERKVTLWDPLFNHLIWLLACVLLLFDRRLTRPQIVLLLMALFFPVLVTGMAWLFTRYLLVPLAIQAVVVVLAAGQVGARVARNERAALGIALAILGAFALLFIATTDWGVKQERTREIVRRVEDAQSLLAAAGVTGPNQLMTNNRLYQIMNEPDHPQYALFQRPSDAATDVPGFLSGLVGPQRPSFLLFDWTSHAIRTIPVDTYRPALSAANDLLVPLHLTDAFSFYCLAPCLAEQAQPVDAELSPGLTLTGYRAHSGGDRHGLYLYWRLAAPISEPRQLALTLRDEGGAILFQTLGDPQQGTFPMDQWPVDETVVDFYLIQSTAITPEETYYLTIDLIEPGSAAFPNATLTISVRFSPPS